MKDKPKKHCSHVKVRIVEVIERDGRLDKKTNTAFAQKEIFAETTIECKTCGEELGCDLGIGI